MDDSDDYFDDDIVFDEETIAKLDEEESKFATQQPNRPGQNTARLPATQQHTPPFAPQPPTKRLKTAHAWSPPVPAPLGRNFSLEDLELPEISVNQGFYGVDSSQRAGMSQTSAKNFASGSTSHAMFNHAAIGGPQRSRPPPPVSTSTVSALRENNAQQRPPNHNSRPPVRTNSGSTFSNRFPNRQPSYPSPNNARHTPAPHQQPPSQPKQPTTGQGSHHKQLEDELITLRDQMAALQRNHSEAQNILSEALQAKQAKTGEVTILRDNMEKASPPSFCHSFLTHINNITDEQGAQAARAHAAEQAKLRAAKDAAEAMQLQIRKEMKEEMERMKTHFTFKQHELETSIRKPRTARTGPSRDVPMTPMAMGPPMMPVTQMRRWDQHAGPSNAGQRTPTRPRIATFVQENGSPVGPRSAKVLPKQNAMLPGFVNAFLPSSGGRRAPVSPLKNKGKSKSKGPLFDLNQQNLSLEPPSPPSSPIRPMARSQKANNTAIADEIEDAEVGNTTLDADISFDMAVDLGGGSLGKMNVPVEMEELANVEPPDWVEQLSQVVFTHASRTSGANTLQTLLNASSSLGDDASAYSTASARILELLGTSSKFSDFDTLVAGLSASFSGMANLLISHNLIAPLTDLFSLLAALTLFLPSFIGALLSVSVTEHTTDLLAVLCRAVSAHLSPNIIGGDNMETSEVSELAKIIIDFMEVICGCIPNECELYLIKLVRANGVLTTFLNSSQPTWFLQRTTRLLSFFASRTRIYRHLLSFPEDEAEPEAVKDFSQIPNVENICVLLVDSARTGPDADSMRRSILTTLTLLAIAHADGLAILAESRTLIPSLIVLLTNLADPLWEEAEELMSLATQLISTISAITQALMLLHYLVFSPEQGLNLRHKLHHAPHRQFNGVSHMFVVTLGRLSFADPPEVENLGGDEKRRLEQLAEMAHDLLELVVDGPEAESVWAMYQVWPEREGVVDDEEMEARLFDIG